MFSIIINSFREHSEWSLDLIMYKEPDHLEDEEEYNHPHAVERRAEEAKLADFFIGATIVGGAIMIIATFMGWIPMDNIFGIIGCMTIGYFLNLWILKPFLKKRGWY